MFNWCLIIVLCFSSLLLYVFGALPSARQTVHEKLNRTAREWWGAKIKRYSNWNCCLYYREPRNTRKWRRRTDYKAASNEVPEDGSDSCLYRFCVEASRRFRRPNLFWFSPSNSGPEPPRSACVRTVRARKRVFAFCLRILALLTARPWRESARL